MKKLILGLVIGLLIGSAGTAIASSDYVQAVYAKFNIAVDSAESVEVEALVRKGASYYPIRVIAELLDSEVDYIDETRTIVIERPTIEGATEGETVDSTIEDPVDNGGDEVVETEETVNVEIEEPQQEEYSREYILWKIEAEEKLLDVSERSINMAEMDGASQDRLDELAQQKAEHEAELQLWRQRLAELQ